MSTLILFVFLLAMAMALAGIVGDIVVLRSLRKRGVFIPFWARGMPWYLHQACENLPASSANARLSRLSWWSLLAFWLAMFLGALSGPLLNAPE